MNKIEHIGIVVKDIKTSNKLFASLFGEQPYKAVLLETTNLNSTIAKIIEKKRKSLSHSFCCR